MFLLAHLTQQHCDFVMLTPEFFQCILSSDPVVHKKFQPTERSRCDASCGLHSFDVVQPHFLVLDHLLSDFAEVALDQSLARQEHLFKSLNHFLTSFGIGFDIVGEFSI